VYKRPLRPSRWRFIFQIPDFQRSLNPLARSSDLLSAPAPQRRANLEALMATSPSRRYKTILLFGAPGAGKGTQGKILGKIPGFYHLACGDVFRSLDMGSDLGRSFMEYSSRGELVPDELTIEMWRQNMHAQTVLSIYKPNVDLLVLDGIPRNVNQAKHVDQYLEVLTVLHLVCPDIEAMVTRMRRRALKENRIDDADEKVIRRRFEVYDRETRPLLEFYPQSLVHEVNAMGSPAEVLQHALEVCVPIQNEHFRNPLS
jgi:adenylate kinase